MPSFKTKGVCATQIDFEIDDEGRVHGIGFVGGCPGNAAGVARLAEGRPASELVEMLEGLPCGRRPSSCPDQLACALREEMGRRERL
ncbi:MAG: TIGR03905 family TSCPD domain-containing protein [Coriobacteriales bacterium]|jgi:uncharacterized protein (TIGR03905 family)|nr:TIGR03905 family TSCPD domain-containing protein [Coriobacteriales bacterium]